MTRNSSVVALVFSLAFALTLPLAQADENQGTGFTDGTDTGQGTNVVTGQEAPQSGAVTGAPSISHSRIRKHKRAHGKRKHRKGKKPAPTTQTPAQ